jgi:hypothetical protein
LLVPPKTQAARVPAETLERGASIAERAAPWLAGALRSVEGGLRKDGERLVSAGRANEGLVTGDLELRLGADLRAGFDVGVAGVERLRTHWTPVGAAASKPEFASGRVVHHDAWTSTDALVVSGARFAEIALLLRDANAPHRFAFGVPLPRSIRSTRTDEVGDLYFDDARGAAVLRVQAPFVVDATGHRREAKVTYAAGELVVDFDPSGLAYPMLLDPTADIPVLANDSKADPKDAEGPAVVATNAGKVYALTGTPSANSYPSEYLVLDPYVSIGRYKYTTVGSSLLAGRRYAGAAYDPGDVAVSYPGEIIAYGGWTGVANGTWNRFDLGTSKFDGETALNTSVVQPPRVGAMAAPFLVGTGFLSTPVTGVLVYGGNNGATVYTDVFMHRTAAAGWTVVAPSAPSGAPAKRAHTAFVSDTATKLWVAGGIDPSTNTRLADTWALTLSYVSPLTYASWAPVCGAGGLPACPFPARWASAGAYDIARKRMIMIGGDAATGKLADIWEFNPATSTWTAMCGTASTPTCGATFAARSGAGLACVKSPFGRRCFLMGGVGAGSAMLTETWSYYVHGSACSMDADCDTGNCFDGVCCESTVACGTCKACNVTGSIGTCALVPSGQNASSCSAPSACNGAGACQLTNGQSCTTGTQCLSGNCADGYCCNTACGGPCDVCNATPGTCTIVPSGSAGAPSCSPAVCNGSSATCPGGCTKDADCSSASYCAASGKCVTKKVLGAACDPKADCAGGACAVCASGVCVDGVCCDRACTGLCEACSAARKGTTAEDGKCGYAANGELDRAGGCVDSGTGDAGCKNDGKCSGSGSCRTYSSSTSCGSAPATCVGNKASGQFCNGTGTCAPGGTAVDCGSYVCKNGIGCPSACGSDADCVSTAFCDAATSACRAKADIGVRCADARECSSGLCIDNTCCQRPCDGQCEACDVPKAEGKCVPVVGKPHGARTPCAAGSPDKPCEAPSCEGTVTTSCIGRPGADVICQEHSCTAGFEKPEARCDGHGVCGAGTTVACQDYQCALDACRTSCASDADCVAPARCDLSTSPPQCVRGPKCQDEHTSVSGDGKLVTDCAPYRCNSSGKCPDPRSCGTTDDCMAGYACNVATQQCEGSAAPADAQSSGGCSTSGAPTGAQAFAGLAGLAALAGAVARRRGARRTSGRG